MKHTNINLDKQLTQEDWARINLFKKRFSILWENLKDLKLGQLHFNYKKNEDGSYSGRMDLPNKFRLKGLYVDYRCFYLKKEPTHFYGFANFLSSLTSDKDYRLFIKGEKKSWKSDFIENGWFRYNGNKLKTSDVLDMWFNGLIFHNVKCKTDDLNEHLKLFDNSTANSILFMTVYDTILVIRNLNWSINELRPDNLFLKMPTKA